MLILNWRICRLLLVCLVASSAVAKSKDETSAKAPAETGTAASVQPASVGTTNLAPLNSSANLTALIDVLVAKGVLDPSEANTIRNAPRDAAFQMLLDALARKGIVTAADLQPMASPAPLLTKPMPAENPPAQASVPKPAATKVIPAVAPVRVLQLEPAKPDGLVPDLKLGSGARLKLYGIVKASIIYDTSSPYGTDMPLPGFITASGTSFDPGPTRSPEFHAKARFARVGTNFEWPDVAGSKNAITGKLEFDFEGNFSRALNRNISTIRSSMASIRLAYGRIDHRFDDQTSIFALFGQDWTPFGSSTLPNLFETTGLGLGFGTLYERAPQVRFGVGHKVGGSRNLFVQPEFALVTPAYGNDPSNVADQLGYGEKQGADSGRPEIQARLVLQWQLDRAPGVAPAQLIFSGVNGNRKVMVRASDIPLCNNTDPLACPDAKIFQNAFPTGAATTSTRAGWTGEVQLPTHYVTVLTKFWDGSDLRWYFVGSLDSNYNDTVGISKVCGTDAAPAFCTAPSNDGASSLTFGVNREGIPVFAPQRPVRAIGAFLDAAFPLGRIFHADPSGRNAGWQINLHYAFDQANTSDVLHLGNQRSKNDLAAASLCWKMNSLVSFLLEESMYRTRIADPSLGDSSTFPKFEGYPARQWHDFRSEFGPVFSF